MVAWKQYIKSFASFFELSIAPMELMNMGNAGVLSLFSGEHGSHVYLETLQAEIEKQNLIIEHQREMLKQKDKEIELLRRLIEK